jgi:hypothetical protein
VLPNFVIAGAMKAGTTSLFDYVAQHPDVFACRVKDPEFFVTYDWPDAARFMWSLRPDVPAPYDAMFPLYRQDDVASYEALFDGWRGQAVGGEGTALYLACPWAATNIQRLVPGAKIVVILRDPVERAISHYRFERQLDPALLSDEFEVAVRATQLRRNRDCEWSWGLIPLGHYGEQLERYFAVFGRDQVHVCFFEDLCRDPVAVTQQVYAFLGIDPAFVPATAQRHNASRLPRPAIAPATLAWLREQFADDGHRLQRVLDRPLPWRVA